MTTLEPTETETPDSTVYSTQDPSVIEMGESWETETILSLIRRNTTTLTQPKVLMLGEREMKMLRHHLEQAFGKEQICCQKQIFYVGMKVVEIRVPSLVKIAGEKPSPTLERLASQRSTALDANPSRWLFRA